MEALHFEKLLLVRERYQKQISFAPSNTIRSLMKSQYVHWKSELDIQRTQDQEQSLGLSDLN